MRKRELNRAIAEACRVDPHRLEGRGMDQAKRELLERIVAEPIEVSGPAARARAQGYGVGLPRRAYLPLVAALAAAVASLVVLAGSWFSPAGSPSAALGAGVVHLTRVSPHLVLDAPGWHIEGASQTNSTEGTIQFSHADGRPISYLGGRLVITPIVHARLDWREASPDARIPEPRTPFAAAGEESVLGARAQIFAHPNPRLGTTKYLAIWELDGRRLELRSPAPSRAEFLARLRSLRLVSRRSWLQALPNHHVDRGTDRTSVEEAAFRELAFHCPRPLPPALVATSDDPRVAFFESECGR